MADKVLKYVEYERDESLKPGDCVNMDGYWCIICGKFLERDGKYITHDNIYHPLEAFYFEDEYTMH